MCEGVRSLIRVQIVIQVVYMHHAIAETASGSNVEVSNDFVDAETTLYPTSLISLRFQLLRVVFPFALLDAFAFAERPRHSGVRLSYFLACLTTAGLRSSR